LQSQQLREESQEAQEAQAVQEAADKKREASRSCGPPPSLAFGTGTVTPDGTLASFSCLPGFVMTGDAKRQVCRSVYDS
jgi:hypothetical protein